MGDIFIKRCLAFGMLFVCITLFVSCDEQNIDTNTDLPPIEITINDNTTTVADDTSVNEDVVILDHPPALLVTYGSQTIETLFGTTSWSFPSEGQIMTLEGDCSHTLKRKDSTPILNMGFENLSTSARIQFSPAIDIIPDEIILRCWGEDCWGNENAVSEDVHIPVIGSDITLNLKQGNFVYEIKAIWSTSEIYQGSVLYSFCTVISENN